ncbi:Tryptophan biosynthesis protein TRP1 [Includes: Indole-3-glycerol phosphate synthase (IGPS) [Durusdinium trenchii]|uniref:Tryptophan biosynthesis protein TRP1 n=1 Tax=Durusdinium trenchii TaxID=1381693 RepID=A0ABP0L1X7_9DINO
MDEEDEGHLYGFGDPTAKRSKLQEIVQQRVQDVALAKQQLSSDALQKEVLKFQEHYGKPQSLVECISEAEKKPWTLALAAEFKRASPSKGDINPDLDAAEQALEYTQVGASILSVLTEPKWFKGSLEDLKKVRVRTQDWANEAGQRRPACLRKDFLIDEYQVDEALAHGADTVLLMVSVLSRSKLRALVEYCRANGIEPLVEVVTSRELDVALSVGARVIGVNNRNLHTLVLDKHRTAAIAQELRERSISFGRGESTKLLALSGLATAEDVAQCREISCSGILVGEALMRASDPGAAILAMMGPSSDGALPVRPGEVLVKVCGVRRPEDALCAVKAGANLIGVIFASSKRQASLEQAQAVVQEVQRFGERSERAPAARATNGGYTNGGSAGPRSPFSARSVALRKACQRSPLVVGVFMDQGIEEVVQKAQGAQVDAVQLHGGEDPAFLQQLQKLLPDVWLIKVVHLPPCSEKMEESTALVQLKERLSTFADCTDALLLDTAVKGSHSGGTGAAFDWQVAKQCQEQWGIPVIVAGGLNDANVSELVSTVHPFGVDVASGVEDAPGVKNSEKTPRYVREAKRARFSN